MLMTKQVLSGAGINAKRRIVLSPATLRPSLAANERERKIEKERKKERKH
jgi:hypothetical protein